MIAMDLTMIFKAVLIGLIEGLTEFLPVSSTGHIILAEDVLGFQGPPGKVFEIVIQLGAIMAVCWLYRAKILATTNGVLARDAVGHAQNSIVYELRILLSPGTALVT